MFALFSAVFVHSPKSDAGVKHIPVYQADSGRLRTFPNCLFKSQACSDAKQSSLNASFVFLSFPARPELGEAGFLLVAGHVCHQLSAKLRCPDWRLALLLDTGALAALVETHKAAFWRPENPDNRC